MSTAKITKIGKKQAIEIDGKIYPPMLATICTNVKDHVSFDDEYMKALGDAGLKVFFVMSDTTWCKPNAFEQFQEDCEKLLAVNPDAYIMVRIGLHPPVSWVEEHPEECFTYSDGSKPGVRILSESYLNKYPHLYSLASEKWREDAGKALKETLEKIDALPYADRIIGYFLAAGGTSEWYYLLGFERGEVYGDVGDAMTAYYRKWLKRKYQTVENLRSAWQNENVTFETAVAPSAKSRYFAHYYDDSLWYGDERPAPSNLLSEEAPNIGTFLNVDKYAEVEDYYHAVHDATAESQVHFASIVKEHYQGEKLVGSFYGSFGCTDFFDCGTAGGVSKITASGKIDLIAAPGVYVNRQPGGFTGQRQMPDSLALHNVIFVTEEDTRTHLESNFFRNLFDYYTPEDSVGVIKRDFGREIADGYYGWWFDQKEGGGRYKHEAIINTFKKQQEIAKAVYADPRDKQNEIAFIYDEESIHSISNQSTRDLVEYFRNYEIARIGAGVDQYYHNDLSNPEMPDYKLYVFFNTLELTDKERAEIKAKLSKNHATALWVYASGVINREKEKRFSPEHISSLTGIKINCLKEKWGSKIKMTKAGYSRLNGLDVDSFYGDITRPVNSNILLQMTSRTSILSPVFYVEDESAEILGQFANNGLNAFARKDTGEFVSLFFGSKILSADLVRSVAKSAGCHIYTDSEDVVYTNGNYVTVHASFTGERTLSFPTSVKLTELYEDKVYAEKTETITLTMKKGETKTFLIEKA